MSGNIIAKLAHGSKLFGTSTDKSDVDIKTVFTPEAKDILMGRIATTNRLGTTNILGKNTSDDKDQDNHDLMKFMRLVESGAPEGFEILFAPEEFHLRQPSDIWKRLQSKRQNFLHADLAPFERMIRKNSTIVLIGAEEEHAAMKLSALLNQIAENESRRKPILPHVNEMIEAVGNESLVRREVRAARDGTSNDMLVIAHKSMPVNESINFAIKLTNSIANEAATNQVRGTLQPEQWKDLSLAVRIASQMVEMLETEKLTFPRPEREFLYDIKVGKISADAIKTRLNFLEERIEIAKVKTGLPALPKRELFEEFIIDAHLAAIRAEFDDLAPVRNPNELSLS